MEYVRLNVVSGFKLTYFLIDTVANTEINKCYEDSCCFHVRFANDFVAGPVKTF